MIELELNLEECKAKCGIPRLYHLARHTVLDLPQIVQMLKEISRHSTHVKFITWHHSARLSQMLLTEQGIQLEFLGYKHIFPKMKDWLAQ